MENKTFAYDTTKRSLKQWIQGLILLFVGLTIAHLGVSLFLISELGTDPFTILIQGIASTVGLSIGTCHVIALISIMVIMLFTTKNYIKPGTVVCAFFGGWIIDIFLWLFDGMVTETSPLWSRLVILILGCIILSFGMSLVIKSNSGTGPNDLIAIVITDKINEKREKKIQFRIVRILCDILFAVCGFLLGGIFGIGTIVAALLIGPVVQFFLPISEKIAKNFIQEK